MDGRPAEGIFRMNSIYPKDGFWWDSQLRITPAFQGGVHFLEPYAHAVADLDACRITRGGLFLDKAHTEAIQQFARAYRALPRQKFDTVGTSTDPVAVRTLVHDGRRYFYAVNRDYYPVKVDVAFTPRRNRRRTWPPARSWICRNNGQWCLGRTSCGVSPSRRRWKSPVCGHAAGGYCSGTAGGGRTGAGRVRKGSGGGQIGARHGRNGDSGYATALADGSWPGFAGR